MSFKIELSDQRFRVVAPDGEYEEAVSYCSVSTVEYDGSIYGTYLAGDEPELDALAATEETTMQTVDIKVYNFSDWPNLVPVETELEEVEFDEDVPDGPVVDVKVIS